MEPTVALEMVEFINLRMPAGRKVAGSLFDELAKVPLSADMCLTRLCSAVVKANASCDANFTQDQVGKLVTTGDVKALAGKYREQSIHAEGVIRRTREAVDMSKRECIVDLGDFEIEVLLSVLQKHPSKLTITQVADNFVKSFRGVAVNRARKA